MQKQIDPRHVRRLLATLRRLPSRQRTIFLALVDEEANYPVLAERFGVTVTEVEREFVRALVALDAAADG